MILESITEPTATITLTLAELKRIRDGQSRALECLYERIVLTTDPAVKEHKALQACIDSVIRAIEE